MGVTVEPGEDGRVYVVDRDNRRVQVFSKAGVFVRTLGMKESRCWRKGAQLPINFPMDVSVDPGQGNGDGRVYVSCHNFVSVFLKV